jgi:peptidoglycan/xylan/chitin deacetylase (PgdA/CDA1 family)
MKPISPDEVLRSEQAADTTEQTEQQHTVVAGKTPFSPDNSSRSTKRRSTSRRKTVPNIEAAPDQPKRAKPVGTTIYLTFDDGPSHLTLPIASFLKSEGVQATFFVLGRNIKGREKAVTATIAMGHRVGNHTLSHNLKKLRSSLESETSEVKRTGDMIERLGGDGKIVRIPYGVSGKALVSQVAAEGVQIFEWDINSNDSTQRGVRDHLYIENTILNQLNKSSRKHLILLFHDGAGHDSTLVAIRDLIPRLKQEGYRFGLLARSEKVARTTEKGKTVQ